MAGPLRTAWRRRALLGVLAALAPSACAGQGGVPSAMWSWNRPFAPYRVIGNVYYVGSNQISQFLITTPAGHILLDSGFEASVPRLRANVAALGFRFEDIKLLLTSHAHIDHVQGHALVRRLTGAAVVDSARDGAIVAAGGKGESVYDGVYAWAPCPVDRVVADGDRVELGGTTLTAHLTPGHTMGAVTWTMQVPAEPGGAGGAGGPGGTARPLDVVFFPSANINPGVRLVGNARYPEIAEDFARSFAVWKALPCDVFLGVHGGFYDMAGKRARQEAGASPNPFIDPEGYRRFVREAEAHFEEQLAAERPR
jgi:metallo-beta-lactamase class B